MVRGISLTQMLSCLYSSIVESKPGVERNPRYSPHPALTMFNTGMGRISFPGFAMPPSLTGGMSSYSIECIRDDIVCPAYCLMEDEWGCKSCPCGPGNTLYTIIFVHECFRIIQNWTIPIRPCAKIQ